MSINTTESLNKELLLHAIDSLDLPQGVYDKAKERYESVGKFLADSGSDLAPFKPSVYPQGSAAMGTAIRPLGKDDFDIDVACEMEFGDMDPMQLRKRVEDRLRQDGNYSRMLNTEKNRCLRLDYSEQEKFHLDIIAARSALGNSFTGTAIEVPDRDIQDWTPSDPKGYLAWFEEQKKVLLVERGVEVLANVEPAPEQPGRGKTPLQLVIQLLKRNRDLEFEKNPEVAPISIIITTLSAKAYNHQSDIEEALVSIVEGMPLAFDRLTDNYAEVLNPTNRGENFADKWQEHPERRKAFFDWHGKLSGNLHQFFRGKDMKTIGESLERLVGQKSSNSAFEAHSGRLNTQLKSGGLFAVGAGAALTTDANAGGRSVPPHTNYGDTSDR